MIRFLLRSVLFLGLAWSASADAFAQDAGGSFFSGEGRMYNRPRLSPLSIEFGAGSAYYVGDLINKPFKVSSQNNLLNLSFCLGARYQITEFISVRGTFTYFRLKAFSDRNDDWKDSSFQSNNFEGAIELVHDILPKSWTEEHRSPVNGYIFGGFGGLRWVDRNTETGKKLVHKYPYTQSALVFPVGFGINYHLFEDSWIGLEAGYRFTTTDFLDNSSYPAYVNLVNDGYYVFGFRASIQLYKGFAVGKQ